MLYLFAKSLMKLAHEVLCFLGVSGGDVKASQWSVCAVQMLF